MSKLTLYYKNGNIAKEYECIKVISCPNCAIKFVALEENRDLLSGSKFEGFHTNLPYVLDDANDHWQYRQPEDSEPVNVVELYSDTGVLLRAWTEARGVSFLDDVISFKVKNKWFSVCGSCMITEYVKKEKK